LKARHRQGGPALDLNPEKIMLLQPLKKLSSCAMPATGVLLAILLAACSGDDGNDGATGTNGTDGTNGNASVVSIDNVLKTNANIAYAVYSDAHVTAINLQTTLQTLVDNPTAENLAAARSAWLTAREPYGQSEVYRFRAGPIDALKDDGTLGEDGDGPEGRINAWPLAEALIDYVEPGVDGVPDPENPDSTDDINGNIIADTATFPTIDKQVLVDNFERGGDERNVTTGYHAIEFLLWGQDFNADGSGQGTTRDNTPGHRPVTDYSTTPGACTSGASVVADNICVRRGQYLLAAADLLVDDLGRVVEAWNPTTTGNHYASFVAGNRVSLAKILEGMGRLSYGELAGERMNIALQADSQEDEHSCFSDNTHRDIVLDAQGIVNSFEGRYVRTDGSVVEGAGIDDLLNAGSHTEVANDLRAALEDTMIKVSVINQRARAGIPFDNQIDDNAYKGAISASISALAAQTDGIEDAIDALQVTTDDLRQDTAEDI